MRLGVLDIGSNTGHLLVVDAHDGSAPLPAHSYKQPLRLAEHLDDDGAVTQAGIDALAAFVGESVALAEDKGCEELLAFATSAVRDSRNADDVLAQVRRRTGVDLEVLSGEDEARLTFLAVRRWFGWSAGRLAVFDIGGGSLEIAAGADETPDVAWSLPLGAARLAPRLGTVVVDVQRASEGLEAEPVHPSGVTLEETGPRRVLTGLTGLTEEGLREVRRSIRADIARDAGNLLRAGAPDRAAATSKTFRSLARICGAAPSGDGPLVRRRLPLAELRTWIPKLVAMSPEELAALPGVSASRTHQIVPGALVAEACMDIFDLSSLEVCPWALREGVILERIDRLRDH
ncbi:Ppx/GppA family phosphatase [Nocardioides sp.]|uniref:Ppx/GppA phosphatase family protein n=1 Tax=Nocardioides sp. TaxID=35761 RepID=UPI0035166B69